VACDLVDEEEMKVSALYHTGHEDDLRTILASAYQMVGSDGLHLDGRTHPRLYGTFPRVLGHYVRETGVLSLEQAVYKMTGFPAARLGLKERGVIRAGAAADLVVFDPATVRDTATYEDPCRYPEGIDVVLVNGVAVKDAGGHTGALPGRVLRHRGIL
jgi:N-acyl-D-amino-acid deacylase